MFTDGRRTDGRKAHRYIPRTYRSVDKDSYPKPHVHLQCACNICAKFKSSSFKTLERVNITNLSMRDGQTNG